MPIADKELVSLFQTDPDRGWDIFVEDYSDLLFSVAAKFAWDEDGRVDLYLHICEKLQADNLRRLCRFEPDREGRPCKLSTWLVTVARNLCIDWIRGRDGRRRLNEPIKRLSELDQLVFQTCYWDGMTIAETYETVRGKHGQEIEFHGIYDSIRRINEALTSNNLWNLANDLMRMVPALSLDSGPRDEDGESRRLELGSGAPGQDEVLAAREFESICGEILASLDDRSKIILKSYYFMELPVREIADLIHIPEHTVYRQIRKLTADLSKRFAEKDVTAKSLPEGVRIRLESALQT